jgi:hypothetical protein
MWEEANRRVQKWANVEAVPPYNDGLLNRWVVLCVAPREVTDETSEPATTMARGPEDNREDGMLKPTWKGGGTTKPPHSYPEL